MSVMATAQPKLTSIKPAVKQAIHGSKATDFELCLQSDYNMGPLSGPVNVMRYVDYIDDVLSLEECSAMCAACDKCDDLKFWSLTGREDDAARAFRDADTVEVESCVIAETIWDRMKNLLPCQQISIADDNDDVNWERELVGDWVASSLNFDILFAKYPSGGAFAPHTDGRAIHNFNTRSFATVIIFLNEISAVNGGGTRFYKDSATTNLQMQSSDSDAVSSNRWTADEALVLDTVSAVPGRMLIFHQSLVHEGLPPASPHCKYIIRSDIMYTRTPAICATPRDLEAYSIFKQAEDLAESGLVDEAIPLFKRSFKLSPELARIMGQG